MNDATINVEGLDALQRDFSRMSAEVQRGLGNAVKATAIDIDAEVKKSIQRGAKTGNVYTRGNTTHQASAPGEAPATDTGGLVSSIYFKQPNPLSATVGSRLAYAYFLEFGTRKIKPRPAWIPAIEKLTPKFNTRVDTALRRATR